MSKNLILVESPSKAKTINKYVGKDYIVEATVGHIRNLPKTKLGVDVDNGFTPTLLNIRGKGDLIKKIRSLASKSKKIFIATDPDREGEAIAQDVADILDSSQKEKIERVLFNEITKKAVNESLNKPIKIDDHLVLSQRARRIMDRIIGYKVSPFLWRAVIDTYGSSLSAGRVQSVALRLVCEREDEIEKFIPTEYWSIVAQFKTEKGEEFTAKLFEVDGKQIKVPPKPQMTEEEWEEFFKIYFAISKKDLADNILEEIKNVDKFSISDIIKKESKKNPYPPFITSTLQVEASRKLRMRPRRTMMLAQQLYEGIDLGSEGTTGLITYMRTDSTRLSDEIVGETRTFIDEKYGSSYLPEKAKAYEQKNKKNVQDAHEAIRPTSLKYTPEFVKEYLDEAQFKLYELIWKRFIACQMESSRIETTSILISANKYTFRSSGTAILFDGFAKIYDEAVEENEKNENGGLIPVGLQQNQELKLGSINSNQHFTKPPARFTESSLIKELENNGIGRPSTYAMIMGTIVDRRYVELIERKITPTKLGRKVNGVLVKNFPDIINVNFTAQMEDELDLIANGETDYLKVLNDFYGPFSKDLLEVEANLEKIICEKCGSELELKIGRFGKYFACTNYPNCKNIKSLKEIAGVSNEPEYTGDICPKCGSKTVYREGKFGRFIGCEKYPDCDFTKVITLGMKCPKCEEGEVITKRTKRGRIFYGCNKYPDCDYASWTMPKPKEENEEEISSDDEY